MSVDLHIHSVASDGLLTPHELLQAAGKVGLSAIAITDHDCVDAVGPALKEAHAFGIEVIPALELSSHIGEGDIHFLGYFVDHQSEELARHLQNLREARRERAGHVLDLLRTQGVGLSMEQLSDVAGDGAVGRAHIATLMTREGHTKSVSDAFERFLARGACCYVEKEVMAPDRVIALIRHLGGVAVLAHPGVSGVGGYIDMLAAEGLDGIEAFHADHTLEQIHEYSAMADRLGLLVTGGSDFHGEAVRGLSVGAIDVPDWVVDGLKERHQDR